MKLRAVGAFHNLRSDLLRAKAWDAIIDYVMACERILLLAEFGTHDTHRWVSVVIVILRVYTDISGVISVLLKRSSGLTLTHYHFSKMIIEIELWLIIQLLRSSRIDLLTTRFLNS